MMHGYYIFSSQKQQSFIYLRKILVMIKSFVIVLLVGGELILTKGRIR